MIGTIFGFAICIGMLAISIALIWHFRIAIVKTLGVIIGIIAATIIIYFVGKFFLGILEGISALDLLVLILLVVVPAVVWGWKNSKDD